MNNNQEEKSNMLDHYRMYTDKELDDMRNYYAIDYEEVKLNVDKVTAELGLKQFELERVQDELKYSEKELDVIDQVINEKKENA